MPDTILVVIEQREGKLNRVSWETITAGQAIAAATGWTLEAAVVGAKVAELAREVAAKKVTKVFASSRRGLSPTLQTRSRNRRVSMGCSRYASRSNSSQCLAYSSSLAHEPHRWTCSSKSAMRVASSSLDK